MQGLVSLGTEFVWGSEQQNSFEDIEHAIGSATLMRHPDPTKQFMIDCDASTLGIGAALRQADKNGKEYSAAFASRRLRANECKWTITGLEALAMGIGNLSNLY